MRFINKYISLQYHKNIISHISYSVISVLLSAVVVAIFLQPLWSYLHMHVPGEPNTPADFTFPVDTVFYIRNAELGYRWSISEPTSLWFHPIVSLVTATLPKFIPANWRIYMVSVVSALLALIVSSEYAKEIIAPRINPKWLLVALLIPGGLNIGVGNVELTSLLFNSLVLLTAIRGANPLFTLIFSILAILTKPNGLYIVLPLLIYGIDAFKNKRRNILINCVIGLAGVIGGWLSWIWFVDTNVGIQGAYWTVRAAGSVPLYQGILSFMTRSVSVIISQNWGEKLKFGSAFLVILLDLWLIIIVPFKSETDRLVSILSVLSMLVVTFLINNPNKLIVYALTLPCHFPIHFAFLQKFSSNELPLKIRLLGTGIYSTICVSAAIFFALGTPLGWYY